MTQDELDAERWREFATGEPLTIKMKKAVVIFGPNKERDYAAALCEAIDTKIEQRKNVEESCFTKAFGENLNNQNE